MVAGMKTLFVALGAALVFAAATAADTSAGRAGAADQATLTVSIAGSGAGWVTSEPAGISCGTICSASFAVGTTVTLTATPAVGSTAAIGSSNCLIPKPPPGWKGPVPRGSCKVTLSADTSVQATFSLIPPCVVPNVRGYILYVARQRLRSGNCRAGTIRRVFSRKVERTIVISQTPRQGSQREHGASVDLVVSKGRRRAC
jgi:hypothetical protein